MTFSIDGRAVLGPHRIARVKITVEGQWITDVQFDGQADDSAVRLPDEEIMTAGLIDLQVNGAMGGEFRSTPQHLAKVGHFLLAHGVTAFLPTVTSSPKGRYAGLLGRLRSEAVQSVGATPLGFHLEGPFLAPEHRGGHPQACLIPDASDVGWYLDVCGDDVRVVTLAPEVKGVVEHLVGALAGKAIRVMIGHSGASAGECDQAIMRGAVGVTHLFNAMNPPLAREAGVVGAVLAGDRGLYAGLIADLVHVDRDMLTLAIRSCPDQVFLVSDSSAVTGLPVGRHVFEDRAINADGFVARLDDGTLVGSTLTLDRAIRNLVTNGICSFSTATWAASARPAQFVGARDRGVISVGKRADLVVWDAGLKVRAVMKDGQWVG